MDFLSLCDFYKTGHFMQYPPGTQYVYSNWTARSSRVPMQRAVTFFGLQYFLGKYLTEVARETMFDLPKKVVLDRYRRMLDNGLAGNSITLEHIKDLLTFGTVPLEFCALPEGTDVPLRVPMFTIENTHPDFYWVTNYIETLLSTSMWMFCTSAATAKRYRSLLDAYAGYTGGDPAFVPWQGHDFSFRGMASPEAAAMSGAAHLLFFTGTDTIPAIQLLADHYYGEQIGGSVPATEHSVMCAGGQDTEVETFARLLNVYPTGVVSIVSDTWDLWKVLTETLPALKAQIMAREGKLVIRPDSGDPVEILCGRQLAPDSNYDLTPEGRGVIQLLWDVFGGTVNDRGYKVLDPHIGAIYGDSITEERAGKICQRLSAKGFASTNIVFGIGSYTYQYVTRDVHGFAIKATWAKINGQEVFLHKDPVTDDGVKKSARGRISVERSLIDGKLVMIDGLTREEQNARGAENLLEPVWRNGRFLINTSLADIRRRVLA